MFLLKHKITYCVWLFSVQTHFDFFHNISLFRFLIFQTFYFTRKLQKMIHNIEHTHTKKQDLKNNRIKNVSYSSTDKDSVDNVVVVEDNDDQQKKMMSMILDVDVDDFVAVVVVS